MITSQGSTELVKSVSITNLLAQRDAIMSRLHEVHRLLGEAHEIGAAAQIFTDDYRCALIWVVIGSQRSGYISKIPLQDDREFADIKKRLDTVGWDLLMRESGMFTLMDTKAREAWSKSFDNTTMPELTVENIRHTFKHLYDTRGDMFDQGVINCFKRLSWDYKTNKPHKFGKRIVHRVRDYGHISRQLMNELVDLNRVFCILDGKPEEDHRNDISQRLYNAEHNGLEGNRRFSQFKHEDTYMKFRVFMNGNAHVTFLRLDLVDHLNKILAKHFPDALPARID